jgi:hypothetical protein
MHDEERFSIQEPWVFDPQVTPQPREDVSQGFATRALHAGFHPPAEMERFRSFVPPITRR